MSKRERIKGNAHKRIVRRGKRRARPRYPDLRDGESGTRQDGAPVRREIPHPRLNAGYIAPKKVRVAAGEWKGGAA